MTTYQRWYRPTGATISVEAGSDIVTGSAECTFTNQVVAGDALLIRSGPNAGLMLEVIETPASDLQLRIDQEWPGVTQAGLEFAVLPVSVKRSLASDVHARLSQLAGRLLHPFKVTGTPETGLGDDSSIAIDVAAKLVWFKQSGSWGDPVSFVGEPGEVSAAQLATAVSGIIGGASATYDTLKKIEDKLAPILAGANSAYDTFAELYAYIQSDQTAAAAVTTALSNRLRFDAAQVLTAQQQDQARSNIGIAGQNLLINGDFQINERAYLCGTVAPNAMTFDRWRAAAGGADVCVAGYTVTLYSGTLIQVVEPMLLAGVSSLASTTVTVSCENPSHDMFVEFGSAAAFLTAGPGRRSVTMTTGAGDAGNLAFKFTRVGGGTVSFGRMKLEVGAAATSWAPRPASTEQALAWRYYQRAMGPIAAPALADGFNSRDVFIGFRVPMRTSSPTITVAWVDGGGSPVGSSGGTYGGTTTGINAWRDVGSATAAIYIGSWSADAEL